MTHTAHPEPTTLAERRAARDYVGWSGARFPVRVVPGATAPKLLGEESHYETRDGSRIRHPSAYSRKGFSNMVYCRSTVRVEVGARWLDRRHMW
jgi:hypothetical protein